MLHRLVSLYHSFYLTRRFYMFCAACVLLFGISYFFSWLFSATQLLLFVIMLLVVLDFSLLYTKRKALLAGRICSNRFSNGDNNTVQLQFFNNYNFPLQLIVVDELPIQFQERNWQRQIQLKVAEKKYLVYHLRPVNRGEYQFGNILAFASSPLSLVQRKFTFPATETVLVYPSFIQMRQYSLTAVSSHLNEVGSKRLRKLGNSTEFEQIKEYVTGDDYRTINWKATARKSALMVNTYVDEKSQQVFCLIDKSRNMQMPFNGMTLLDYAINASLVISNVALHKQDKAGLLTFAEKLDTFLPAEKHNAQMERMLDGLYKEQTNFLDANYETLYSHIRSKIKQRSLLVLFTNFESTYALERQLPYLKKIAYYHLLLVVVFENTEIKSLQHATAANTEEIYMQVIADKFMYEKKLIVKELKKNGITTILTTPEKLTIDALNKYLEVKARQAI